MAVECQSQYGLPSVETPATQLVPFTISDGMSLISIPPKAGTCCSGYSTHPVAGEKTITTSARSQHGLGQKKINNAKNARACTSMHVSHASTWTCRCKEKKKENTI